MIWKAEIKGALAQNPLYFRFGCCRRCCRKREEVADVGNVDDAAKMADKQKQQHDRREQQPWDEEMV
jgi:hypothetical protein